MDASTVEQANKAPPKVDPKGALPAVPVVGSTDYRVGPLDLLDVEVFQVPDLTRSVRVSAAGEISLPLIGRVAAGGKTVPEIEAQIAGALQNGYLENPQVTVFVKEYQSQRVTIEGALRQPGNYYLTGRTSLLQIIAEAKGLDELANPGACVVYRTMDGKRYAAGFDIRQIRKGLMVDPEVIGGDIVVVDYSGTRSGMKDL
ncbi:MAG TPA: polysaccharide biosynthesis/export family protein, partial [Steroidobacteraceae bacterium]|nr:polysaccharide biosynthesis/export family protein [Steroidobacteraceae bacterium]